MRKYTLGLMMLAMQVAHADCDCVPIKEDIAISSSRDDADEAILAVRDAIAADSEHLKRFAGSRMILIDLGKFWEVALANPVGGESGGGLVFQVEKKTHKILCKYLTM